MRNKVNDGPHGGSEPAAARRTRRSQVIIGVTALAAVGLATQLVGGGEDRQELQEAKPIQATAPEVTGHTVPKAETDGKPESNTQQPRTKEERIRAVREAAKKHTTKVNYPLAPPVSGHVVADADLTLKVTKTGGELLKLYSARQDLTGQKELAWVTDEQQKAGGDGCTDKVRFSTSTPAKARPTLLICWKLSPDKSVYTVAVAPAGKPSAKRSLAALDKEWSRLS
jgi:hypothetical protein